MYPDVPLVWICILSGNAGILNNIVNILTLCKHFAVTYDERISDTIDFAEIL